MKFRVATSLLVLLLFCWVAPDALTQCSSLYNTPEFPIATHASDGHTNSWGVNLFTPFEMGNVSANISGIQIYVDNSYGATNYPNQNVYMRHTTTSSYPNANYPGTAGWTHVYQGSYNFPWSGLYTISFNQNNFAYNGTNNVEILFENRSNNYDWNEPWFRRTQSYGAGNYRSKWNGDFGWNSFPGSSQNGSAVRLTYTLSITAVGGNGCGIVLPTGISRFTVHMEGEEAVLDWLADSHTGVGSFEVERSVDPGRFFEWVGTVEEVAGVGEYRLKDPDPLPGESFYRLKYTDQAGLVEYSDVILLRNGVAEGSLQAYVKAGDRLGLIAELPESGAYWLRAMDLQGREVLRQELFLEAGRQEWEVESPHLVNGVLVLELVGAGSRMRTKVLVLD